MLNQLTDALKIACQEKSILKTTRANCLELIQTPGLPPWILDSMHELVTQKLWESLNDRFHTKLTFGTGGIRGRTIAKHITQAEKGYPLDKAPAQYAAIGSNCLNDLLIVRATIALFKYIQNYLQNNHEHFVSPSLVIAHDVRFFSEHFCKLTASTWEQLGGKALIFSGPRSTPQLSFSVRHFKATAGIVITASHNPFYDNGYKVYFKDGAQVVDPHDSAIMEAFNHLTIENTLPYLNIQENRWTQITTDEELPYVETLKHTLLRPNILRSMPINVAFSPLHGTGAVSSFPAMRTAGVNVIPVMQQCVMDGQFSTIASPNPENAAAFELALKTAATEHADIVIATDPDGDRMGAGVKDLEGQFVLLSGNQIGSLLAEYRITTLKELGILDQHTLNHAVLIKSLVTTPLVAKIAHAHGLKCIEVLTGFKWIGQKLDIYEQTLKNHLLASDGFALDYRNTRFDVAQKLLLKYSTLCVLGVEESYGFLGNDRTRDKDANAATLMFCELAAYLKSINTNILTYLDTLYIKYGYHKEDTLNIVYEGSTGMQSIQNILASYAHNPPVRIGSFSIKQCLDFSKGTIEDESGQTIPTQAFYIFELEGGYRYAVRASGTEAKIKFYIFASEPVTAEQSLFEAKTKAQIVINELKQFLTDDAHQRSK